MFDLTAQTDPQHGLPGVRFRTGTVDELDLLCDIDHDASRLFEQAGLFITPPSDRVLSAAERGRWLGCLRSRGVLLAVTPANEAIGFMALHALDGEPYLEQLSVRMHAMRRGVGSALLAVAQRCAATARARFLWLTTYRHLSWNRPFYERAGFGVVSAEHWGEDMAQEVGFQRRVLPAPDERVVMRARL